MQEYYEKKYMFFFLALGMLNFSEFQRLKKIHFIGIGGSGMSGLAQIYHHLGYQVSGSDIKDSQIIRRLKKIGIKIILKRIFITIGGIAL